MGNNPCCSGAKVQDSSEEHGPVGRPLTYDLAGTDSQSGVASPIEGDGDAQTLKYRDGSSYTGQLVNNMRDGHGKFTGTGDSQCYEGQWKADDPHGHGRMFWPDGRSYDGQFSLGKFNGNAKMVWKSSAGMEIYEGEYRDDHKHGHGKFVWPDGRVFEGGWYKGERHGNATYIANGKEYQEVWVEDMCTLRDGELTARQ